MPARTDQWKNSRPRYSDEQTKEVGITKERIVNGEIQYQTWVGRIKIFEKYQVINNRKYLVKKTFDFKKEEYSVELTDEKNNSNKSLIKYYKNPQELNKELKNTTINLDTFLNRDKQKEKLEKIITDIRNLKNSNLLTSALSTLTSNGQPNGNQDELLQSLITTFKYTGILESFYEESVSKEKEKESFITKTALSSILISSVIFFKVIQKIATTLPMKDVTQGIKDYEKAFEEGWNYLTATLDIVLNSLLTAKAAKVAQKIFFSSKKEDKKKIDIKNFNINDFLDGLITILSSTEEKNIYNSKKYLEELQTIEDFISNLKAIENTEDFILSENLKDVMEKLLSSNEEENPELIEKAKQLINKTFDKFTKEVTTFKGIAWWNSIKNIMIEAVVFSLSAISITGASRNTLALGQDYELKKWLTHDILNLPDWVGNFVRYIFLYPSALVFEKAFKILNIPLNKPFDKFSNWLNSLPFVGKISAALVTFVSAIGFSNTIKTWASLVASNSSNLPQTIKDLGAVLLKPATPMFFALGWLTDMFNCFVKGKYANWTHFEKKVESNVGDLHWKLLDSLKKEFPNTPEDELEELSGIIVGTLSAACASTSNATTSRTELEQANTPSAPIDIADPRQTSENETSNISLTPEDELSLVEETNDKVSNPIHTASPRQKVESETSSLVLSLSTNTSELDSDWEELKPSQGPGPEELKNVLKTSQQFNDSNEQLSITMATESLVHPVTPSVSGDTTIINNTHIETHITEKTVCLIM